MPSSSEHFSEDYMERNEYQIELTHANGVSEHIPVQRSNAQAVLDDQFEMHGDVIRACIQQRPKPLQWTDLMSTVRSRRL